MTTCQLKIKSRISRTSLVVQWLRLDTSTARGMGLIPGQGRSHIPPACVHAKSLQLGPTLCNPTVCVVHQAPRSMRFSRQEYWSGLPFPPPGDLPNPGIEPVSLMFPASAGGFLTTEPPGQPKRILLPKIGRMYLEQCSSTGDPVALQGTFGRARRYFCLSQLGGVLSASSE